MRDDRRLRAAIGDRLLHRIEHVQVLNAFDLKMRPRQFGADDIGVPRGTAILLASERFEESGLAELVPPKALDPFAFLS